MLEGKAALITGASRGIGRAIALELAGLGAAVAVNYQGNKAAAEEVVAQIMDKGGRAVAIKGNVSVAKDADNLVKCTVEELQSLDILVNNAGITRDNLIIRMKEEDWNDVIAVNLSGTFYCCKAAAKVMMKARKGRIINISSVVGVKGNVGQANYAGAKAGVIGLTKALAKELGPRGITVNCLAPGYIDTDMTKVLQEAQREKIVSAISLGRMGTPEDIAPLAGFLSSDAASYITGQIIAVDGGMTI